MELARALGESQPVFVLDDGIVSSGKTFPFSSIEEAATECLLVLREAFSIASQRIVLGGWSYGGVVAVEMVRQITASQADKLSAKLEEKVLLDVQLVVIFDAPLRSPILSDATKEVDERIDSEKDEQNTLPADFKGTGDKEIMSFDGDFVEHHFRRCTALLKTYQKRPWELGGGFISCPLLDVRPSESDYDCGIEAVEEVMIAAQLVRRVVVPQSSHWTMMFGAHAASVAAAVKAAIAGQTVLLN